MILTATTETAGYAPGQTIEIQLDVDNRSKQNIHEFKIGFYKVGDFFLNVHFINEKKKKIGKSIPKKERKVAKTENEKKNWLLAKRETDLFLPIFLKHNPIF